MLVEYLKAKIHGATITQTVVEYQGSLTIDRKLMDAVGLLPHEKVAVFNFENQSRIETYVIEGEAGTGVVGLNGPAARLGEKGQRVVIVSYALLTPEEAPSHQPLVVHLDARNNIIR